MNLFENPLPILAVGAVLVTLASLVFLARRNLASLVVLAVVVVLTLLLLVVERVVVTEREEIEQTLDALLVAVQSNDVSSVLALIDPEATRVRGDAEALMPLVEVEDTGATAVETDVDTEMTPGTAITRCQGRLRGVHPSSGATVFFFDRVELHWIERDGRWLLQDFAAFEEGKPLDAVNSLRGKR